MNNKNETFKDSGASAGVAFNGDSRQAVFSDYDGDGDLDLFVVNNDGPSVLYRNTGNLKFQNVTSSAGLSEPKKGASATFADLDNDGDMDLTIVQSAGGNLLYKNRGTENLQKFQTSISVTPQIRQQSEAGIPTTTERTTR